MLQNYLKIALRNLLKHKAYSFINIVGLALGMACCVLILLYVQHELSYDKFHREADRLFRVAVRIDTRGVPTSFAPTMGPLAAALVRDYPEITEAVQILPTGTVQVSPAPDQHYYENRAYLADSSFFRVFSFPLLHGDAALALAQGNAVVITREKAMKYFSEENALGKRLEVNGTSYLVTGVMQDVPANSHFQPEVVGALKLMRSREFMQNWHATMLHTYIKIAAGVSPQAVEQKISKIADRYVGEQIRANNQSYTFFLQPITAIHLRSDLRYELEANSRTAYVQIFAIAAVLILVIACINFMNLATARSLRRAKEVGLRKVVGAHRAQLMKQFLGESLLYSVAALLLALTLVEIFLPTFNALAAKELDLNLTANAPLLGGLALIAAFVGLLSGSYPAFFISAFRPAEVLKGKLAAGRSASRFDAHALRQALVVLQFSISIALITGTLVISHQLDFLRAQNLGFAKEQMLVLALRGRSELAEKFETYKSEFLQHPSIVSASVSHSVPGREVSNNLMAERENPDNRVQMNLLFIDHDFLQTYGIPLLAGRNFSKEIITDTNGKVALLNEAAMKAFGWNDPSAVIGRQFDGFTGPEAIGVVNDFHFKALRESVAPLMLLFRPRSFQYLTLRLKTENTAETMAFVRRQWIALLPDKPFEYFFLDEDYDKQYQAEQRLGTVFSYFSILAICIACFGLLGLASFAAEQRTKEIGVRKMLGATVTNVIGLLSKDFAKLVLLANLMAWPMAYFAMNKWLQDFAYRIEIGWWVFGVAGGMALLLALLTVSTQAIKAALANPVEALRYE
jgi:putative ABC transport system permease protein